MHAYRKDIDGLRAIAVLTVIAFHAQWPLFQGGFVGVDVFFVISGYLMGSLIIKDVATGKFSIVSFYERRIRRIFPALAFMMLITSGLAYCYLLPSELRDYGKSVIAATFSFSNIYFNKYSNYFNIAAPSIPLLHTWSLAVEEQFYIFLPIFVIFAHRIWPAKLSLLLIIVTLISFGLSTYGAFVNRTSTFYLLQTRAWELLLGTLISLNSLPHMKAPIWSNVVSATGLALVIVSAISFSPSTIFPGFAALMPCAGAGLIILAGRWGSSQVGHALSWPPLVFVGQISYSLYLWHWPVFVFTRMSELFPLGDHATLVTVSAVFATTIIATLSWKYVEAPFRSGPTRPSRKRLFEIAGAAVVVLAAIGLSAIASRGFPSRYMAQANAIASYLKYGTKEYMRTGTCFLLPEQISGNINFSECLHTDNTKNNYLLIGDSYAAHLWYGLSIVFHDVNFLQATVGACRPVLGQQGDPLCSRIWNYIFSDYLQHHKVDGLILAAAWREDNLGALSRTLDWAAAHGIRVILIGPIVQYDDALPRLLAFSLEYHDPTHADHHRRDLSNLDEEMRQIAERRGVKYISLYKALCERRTCEVFASPGVPLQFDYGHLTKDGSVLVAEHLLKLRMLAENLTSLRGIAPPER